MITSEKLAIYREFGGDEDGWVRSGCPKQDIINDEDWAIIRNLIQELSMLKRNIASKEYADKIRKRLAETALDQATAEALLDLA